MSTTINSLILSQESLALFENNIALAKCIDWSYSDRFTRENAKIGATCRVRRQVMYSVQNNNLAWNAAASAVIETEVKLCIDRTMTVPLSFSEYDKSLRIDRFSDRYMKPAISTMASTLDSQISETVVNSAVGTAAPQGASDAGTVGPNYGGYMVTYSVASDANLVTAVTTARQVLLDQACPDGDIYGVLSTAAQSMLVRAQMTLFNPLTAVGDKYRRGYIGTFNGIEFNYSQNLVSHLNGTVNTIAVTAGELTTGWAETSSVTVTATAGIRPGDVYEVTGAYIANPLTKSVSPNPFQFQVVSVTNGTTLVVGPAIITGGAYQNVSATIVGKTTTLKGGTGTTAVESLVFHKSAIVAAAVPFDIPRTSSVDIAAIITPPDSGDGFKFRFLRDLDAFGATGTFGANVPGWLSRFDTQYGIKTANPQWIVRLRPV